MNTIWPSWLWFSPEGLESCGSWTEYGPGLISSLPGGGQPSYWPWALSKPSVTLGGLLTEFREGVKFSKRGRVAYVIAQLQQNTDVPLPCIPTPTSPVSSERKESQQLHSCDTYDEHSQGIRICGSPLNWWSLSLPPLPVCSKAEQNILKWVSMPQRWYRPQSTLCDAVCDTVLMLSLRSFRLFDNKTHIFELFMLIFV